MAYVVRGLLLFGVTGNMAEETSWSGFVQSRLMSRHGSSRLMLTAIPFSLIHLPLAFSAGGLFGTPWTDVALTWTVLIAAAPPIRLLIGRVLVGTGGSLLAVGFLHARSTLPASCRSSAADGGRTS